jgi:hypothetical protein
VDTSRSRLFVYANDFGRPRYVTDFYISLGKNGVEKSREGDQKTPLGVYTIIAMKDKLPDFYGTNAYPLSYPNEWDKLTAAPATASGCMARPRTPTAARRSPPTAAWSSATRTSRASQVRGRDPHAGGDRGIGRLARSQQLGSRPRGVPQVLRPLEERLGEHGYRALPRPLLAQLPLGEQRLRHVDRKKRNVNAGKTWIRSA